MALLVCDCTVDPLKKHLQTVASVKHWSHVGAGKNSCAFSSNVVAKAREIDYVSWIVPQFFQSYWNTAPLHLKFNTDYQSQTSPAV